MRISKKKEKERGKDIAWKKRNSYKKIRMGAITKKKKTTPHFNKKKQKQNKTKKKTTIVLPVH